MSVNGFSCAPAESAVAQLRNIWSGKIMDRSFGTPVHSWGFFQFTHTQFLLPPKKTTLDVRVYAEIFLSINFVQGGSKKSCKKISKRRHCLYLWGQAESTENYEYFITVPRNFVQDCSSQKIIDLTPVERTRNFFPSLLCHGPNEHHPH